MDNAARDRFYLTAKKVKSLGIGNSGVVDLMRIDTGGKPRLVVRKRCMLDDSMDDEARDRLYHEVHVLSSLSHPNIVSYLHGCLPVPECMCIYMEYAEGGTLARAIKERPTRRPFETRQILLWMAQLTSALQHVHGQCVLHRDLKTQNVFLSKAGTVKLGDFGIAKSLSTYTHFSSTIVGTPYCMAPEVIGSSPCARPKPGSTAPPGMLRPLISAPSAASATPPLPSSSPRLLLSPGWSS